MSRQKRIGLSGTLSIIGAILAFVANIWNPYDQITKPYPDVIMNTADTWMPLLLISSIACCLALILMSLKKPDKTMVFTGLGVGLVAISIIASNKALTQREFEPKAQKSVEWSVQRIDQLKNSSKDRLEDDVRRIRELSAIEVLVSDEFYEGRTQTR